MFSIINIVALKYGVEFCSAKCFSVNSDICSRLNLFCNANTIHALSEKKQMAVTLKPTKISAN